LLQLCGTRITTSTRCTEVADLLSDTPGRYGDSAVLYVHRVGAGGRRHVLDGDRSVVVVNDGRLDLRGRRRVDHVTRHVTGTCFRLVQRYTALLADRQLRLYLAYRQSSDQPISY